MEPGKPGQPGAAGASEGVLASFFNSLLSKKTGQGIHGQPGGQINPPGQNEECKFWQCFLGKWWKASLDKF